MPLVEPPARGGGGFVSASGSAVFLLAEAGLLNGGVATLAKPLIPIFRRRYPDIRLDHRSAVVEHGKVICGSGLAADMQLLTRLVEHVTTPELARWLSDVTSLHQSAEEHLADDPLTANAQIWLEERFAQDVRISELAKAMAVSQQTLLRHFHRHLKVTPQEYIRRLRVTSAQGLLMRTSRSIGQIATLCGYSDVHTFARFFGNIPVPARASSGHSTRNLVSRNHLADKRLRLNPREGGQVMIPPCRSTQRPTPPEHARADEGFGYCACSVEVVIRSDDARPPEQRFQQFYGLCQRPLQPPRQRSHPSEKQLES